MLCSKSLYHCNWIQFLDLILSVIARLHILLRVWHLTKQWHMNEMKNSNLQSLFSSIGSLTSTNNDVDTHIPSVFSLSHTHWSFTGSWCRANISQSGRQSQLSMQKIHQAHFKHPCLESPMHFIHYKPDISKTWAVSAWQRAAAVSRSELLLTIPSSLIQSITPQWEKILHLVTASGL